MKTVIVRYKTKPGSTAENERYIKAVFKELQESSPGGLRYVSFKLADGLSFVHIASIDTADGSNPLTQSPAFKAFLAGIKDRCEEQPVAIEATEIGSYRCFG
jgi:hypothetical protein